MARALASVINVLDPEVIVLGGGISNIQRLYAKVPLLWQPYVFSDHVATRLWSGMRTEIRTACAARHGSGDGEDRD